MKEDIIKTILATAWASGTKVTLDIYEDHTQVTIEPEKQPLPSAVEAPEARIPKPETPEKKKHDTVKRIDHGRIVALYTANPPRSVPWIADDMGISKQTVINHLKHEGIYQAKEAEE